MRERSATQWPGEGSLRLCAIVAATMLLSGCYLLQASAGQLQVMSRSRPIGEVIADARTPASTRERLEFARDAREFAVRELALPDSRSYRKYADLGRPYAVWNVVATPEFSVEPRRWCFPIAGCVSYRGYFDESQARDAGLRLFLHGDDVAVEGVPTYSTLGHLPDPLFNTMLGWREARLAGTIFHELAHERLYVPGDTEFNEAFASVVEDEGVRTWLESRGRGADLESWQQAQSRERDFASLVAAARARLAELYGSGLPLEAMRIEKQREFGRLKFAYERLRADWGGYRGYDGWFARSLNNAYLASAANYQACVPGLRRELQAAGSLPEFYRRAEGLAKLGRAERHARACGPT
jgi:predicted aminopeptidase